jgi:hypothetical protein
MKTVSQMYKSGKAIPNQFIIYSEEGEYFQSYNSIIAFKPNLGKIVLDKNYWDYSATTGKYRNQFLNETVSETRTKIADGSYELQNLNGGSI